MVMFHHEIPYATALARGRVQQAILDELTTRAMTLDDVDMAQAQRLVQRSLEPLS
jgi:hypothetical protein